MVVNLLFIVKFHFYIRKGNKLSNKIGLKRMAIYPTTIEFVGYKGKLMEMQQRRYWKDVFRFIWKSRQKVIDTMNHELPKEFELLAKWMQGNDMAVIVSTHDKMWHYWGRAAKPYLKHIE